MAEILYYENGKPKTAADFQSIPKNMDGFTWAETPGAVRRRTFSEEHGPYKKGDIIWLEPPTYETQTTPPVGGGGVAYPYKTTGFMGKEITYSAQTNYRQYAVRLRALVDNPRNPAEIGAVGTDWAVDEPHAIVEKGSNSNGSYEILANYIVIAEMKKRYTGMSGASLGRCIFTYPLLITDAALIHFHLNANGVVWQGGEVGNVELLTMDSITNTSCRQSYCSKLGNSTNGLGFVEIKGKI